MDMSDIMQIEALCRRTLDRYAVAVAERDFAAFAACFCEDGIWRRPGSAPMNGRAEIRAFMEGLPATTAVVHINGTARIDAVDGDVARSLSYTTVYNAENHQGGIAPMVGPDYVVEYRDVFRRVGEVWLIAARDTTIRFRASYAADLPGVPNPARR